jgi:hypothetical protein
MISTGTPHCRTRSTIGSMVSRSLYAGITTDRRNPAGIAIAGLLAWEADGADKRGSFHGECAANDGRRQ